MMVLFSLSHNFWILLPEEVMEVESINSVNEGSDILMSNKSINGHKKQIGRDPPTSPSQ